MLIKPQTWGISAERTEQSKITRGLQSLRHERLELRTKREHNLQTKVWVEEAVSVWERLHTELLKKNRIFFGVIGAKNRENRARLGRPRGQRCVGTGGGIGAGKDWRENPGLQEKAEEKPGV